MTRSSNQPSGAGLRVVVVGATGNVGTATVRALEDDPAVGHVVGVARRTPPAAAPTATTSWVAADISRDSLEVFAGADVVIHLAWKIQPSRDERELARTNIDGTARVVDAVVAHGVPALVYASSVGAYAPGPKEPVGESWPTTGVDSCIYSRHKAAVERMLDAAESRYPELRLVRMRTSLVFQRPASSEVHRIFLGRLLPWRLPSALRFVPSIDRLQFQVTHADDIADAYRRAATMPVSGPFNIAADPALDPATIAAVVGGRTIPVPATVLRLAASASYKARIQPTEPGWLDLALQSPLLDSARARRELQWEPQRTPTETLAELLEGMGAGAGGTTLPLHPR